MKRTSLVKIVIKVVSKNSLHLLYNSPSYIIIQCVPEADHDL